MKSSQSPPKVMIVVPTIREPNLKDFLMAWQDRYDGVEWVIIEDNPIKMFDLSMFGDSLGITHVSHAEIQKAWGDKYWIMSRKSAGIANFGFWYAKLRGAQTIMMLHDDCFPDEVGGGNLHVEGHQSNLKQSIRVNRWTNTLSHDLWARGVPYGSHYKEYPIYFSHGLWTQVPDVDALTQIQMMRQPELNWQPAPKKIAPNQYFPMSNMNIAFRAELLPCMYFPLMGEGQPFSRFEDVWCGIIMKKICDHLNLGVFSGGPTIVHRRASNMWHNLVLEAPGMEVNEVFWLAVDRINLVSTTVAECYKEIALELNMREYDSGYWASVRSAMLTWLDLLGY